MRRALAVALVLASTGCAARRGVAIRRIVLTGACVASAMDAFTTAQALDRGAREVGVLRAPGGGVRWNVLAPVKLGVCVVPIVASEMSHRDRTPNRLWTGIGAGIAGAYGALAVRNHSVAGNRKP